MERHFKKAIPLKPNQFREYIVEHSYGSGDSEMDGPFDTLGQAVDNAVAGTQGDVLHVSGIGLVRSKARVVEMIVNRRLNQPVDSQTVARFRPRR